MVITGPIGAHNPANLEYFQQLLELRRMLHLDSAAHFLAEMDDSLLPDSIIADFYRLSDALFLPSREEGFGIPILEAALSHRPIFCADIPALRELGKELVYYFSPDSDSVDVAAIMIRHLQNDPVFRLAAAVRREFIWERIYRENIGPLLESILADSTINGEGS